MFGCTLPHITSYDPNSNLILAMPLCYEENLSMVRGKPQQMEMTAEINSNLKYAI
jgi:hypothetical protein